MLETKFGYTNPITRDPAMAMRDGLFYANGPTWTEQTVKLQTPTGE